MNRAAEPYLKVSQIVNAFAASRVLHVASALDLFTAMANEGKTATQLAAQLELNPEALELLLNALVSMGLLRKESQRFYDTPLSHTYLARSGPKYMGHLIRHLASSWSCWEQLGAVLRSGKPVRRWEQVVASPTALEDFIRGMHELAVARGDARWLSRTVSLSRCRTLLDVGGGPGTYAALFCRANPQLHATVVDLPTTLEIARRILRDFDLTGRVTLHAADYHKDAIPGGPYDSALLANILHAETEATNRQLLQKVHDALVPGAVVMIKDHVMNSTHTEPETGALFAVEMLLTTRGRTYSFDEISLWLADVGFRDPTLLRLDPPSNVALVLALRPGKRALVALPRPAAAVAAAPAGPYVAALAPGAAAGTTPPAHPPLPRQPSTNRRRQKPRTAAAPTRKRQARPAVPRTAPPTRATGGARRSRAAK